MGVFSGIRVLDLSRVLAGPSCGQLLADFGADVIKVEDVGGDENRKWAPVVDGESANFLSVNRGKRGMTLNLKSPAGQEILAALVAKSDVVIDSFLPAVAQRLGVDDDKLRAIKPDLIKQHMSTLADDKLEGRGLGTAGYDQALSYVETTLPSGSQELDESGERTYHVNLTLTVFDALRAFDSSHTLVDAPAASRSAGSHRTACEPAAAASRPAVS